MVSSLHLSWKGGEVDVVTFALVVSNPGSRVDNNMVTLSAMAVEFIVVMVVSWSVVLAVDGHWDDGSEDVAGGDGVSHEANGLHWHWVKVEVLPSVKEDTQ